MFPSPGHLDKSQHSSGLVKQILLYQRSHFPLAWHRGQMVPIEIPTLPQSLVHISEPMLAGIPALPGSSASCTTLNFPSLLPQLLSLLTALWLGVCSLSCLFFCPHSLSSFTHSFFSLCSAPASLLARSSLLTMLSFSLCSRLFQKGLLVSPHVYNKTTLLTISESCHQFIHIT